MSDEERKRRIRDPVHGLIVFEQDKIDHLAWKIIGTPEFQRLRRIRQLGFSEFTFPGATHTRFAHCIGAFHVARMLVKIIEKRSPKYSNQERADVAVLAALLHDIGHGPFSHAFEDAVRIQKGEAFFVNHEEWGARIVSDPSGAIFPLLESHRAGLANDIATLIKAKHPSDIYHSIVSSSFDADRLDYLRRDRLMTGTNAGAIDFEWLLDNLTILDINAGADDDDTGPQVPVFCFDHRAMQAACSFLLARYHLYTQVYLHKTTRGFEKIFSALIVQLGALVTDKNISASGLDASEVLVKFLGKAGYKKESYLLLDDTYLWGCISRMTSASDPLISLLSKRLWNREPFRCVDVIALSEGETETIRRARSRISTKFQAQLGKTVLLDDPPLSVYGVIGADEVRLHKRLMIRTKSGLPREIQNAAKDEFPAAFNTRLVRFYAENDLMRDELMKVGGFADG